MITRKTYKPRKAKITMDTATINGVTGKLFIEEQIEHVAAAKNIPIAPTPHWHTFLDLAALTGELKLGGLIPVALLLVARLDTNRNSIVHCTFEDIAKEIKMSTRVVASCMSVLSKMGLITKVGKSSYDISPRLGFYGSPFEWSISLSMEGKGQAAIDATLNQIDTDIVSIRKEILDRYQQ